MGSSRRMCDTQLWLVAFLAFTSLCSLTGANPINIMSAPNVLRVGTAENIFLECQGCTTEVISVPVKVMNFPTKTVKLGSTTVTLKKENNFQQFGQITIASESFSKDPNVKQFVYLQAQFPGHLLEKIVIVSFQSGFIFIQTDKTLYTPKSKIHYRMFAVTPDMKPVDRNTRTHTDTSISIEILTPDNVALSIPGPVSLESGIYNGFYELAEFVTLGIWKVVARFPSNPQYSYSAEFEVKEYVLPNFEVKLSTEHSFFHVEMNEFTISVRATYLFGEDVEGTAYAAFGVLQGNQKKNFPSSLQRLTLDSGLGVVTLTKKHITDTFGDINNLVGSSIFVTVNVLTEEGGEMVKAELRNIKIVKSPYSIRFTKSAKYFQPGMNFDAVVEVLNPDGSPAKRINIILNPGAVTGSTEDNGLARLSINTNPTFTQLDISATTDVHGITQATATMTVYKYNSESKNYLHIGVGKVETSLGENLKVNFNYNNHEMIQSGITYLILSRGQLVTSRFFKKTGAVVISTTIHITMQMMPSFRIIAYYHTHSGEVVSDSVWVDVKDSCMGQLSLQPKDSHRRYFEPGDTFQFRVTGDPEAVVGLVAVDKGVFLLNNNYRLTQKKIWDTVDKQDTGCTPGGGENGLSVFFDAGLIFQSSVGHGTPYRQDLTCPHTTRKKRTSTLADVETSLLSQFKENKERDCCLDGMRETPVSYDCQRRSEYIMDGVACVGAFLMCCKVMEAQQDEMKENTLFLARSEKDDSAVFTMNEIVSRSKFAESWQWQMITLPACSDHTCTTTSVLSKPFPLQDSITTWQFIGIGLSKTHGICVADPLEVISRKDFFIKLHLPYSVVRGEQVEIKAVIYNYRSVTSTVRVDLLENTHVCSAASGHGRYRQVVRVAARSTRSVTFVIIAMNVKLLKIEVQASVQGKDISDGESRMIRVVPEGVLTKSVLTETFSLEKNDRIEKVLNSGILPRNLVPGLEPTTQVFVTGREQLGSLLENGINGKSMGSLITQPGGCGEQNMIGMTLPVIATTYLDSTQQWETVGLDKRSEAIQHIRTGYNNELPYRKSDGSFAVFKDYPGSTWLTAYVAKVFSMAYTLVAVDSKVICGAIRFLIQSQQDNGMFKDIGTIIHGEMIGDVRGKDTDVSMTAFCLISMEESRTICQRQIPNLQEKINAGITYLEGRLNTITNPYAAAIASYALAFEDKLNRQILFNFISQESNHWPVRSSNLLTLEATSYALLALVKVKDFQKAKPVVRWFNQQQKHGGGYGSTQATIMVYQAIAEYWTSANEAPYHVNIDLGLPGRSKPVTINFNKLNHYATKKSEIMGINKNVSVVATGTGEAVVKIVSLYYALPREKESNCEKFNLSVQLLPGKDDKTFKLKINVKYLDVEHDATMAILDVAMLSGFSVLTEDLDLLATGVSRIISKYDINSPLTERGSVILYLDKISHTREEEVAFRIRQDLQGNNLQPAAVTVYEYYDHQNKDETHCMKFYHPQRENGELLRLCTSVSSCTCAEEECTMQKKKNVDNNERIMKTCESTEQSKTDYVYKATVETLEYHLATDIYKVRIVEVIKEGTDIGSQGNIREYLSHKRCRKTLDMDVGKSYLIMGVNSDVRIHKESETYQYVFGERTWVEYWPTPEECQTQQYSSTCKGIEKLVYKYKTFACYNK